MIRKTYYLQIIIRLFLITSTCLLFTIALYNLQKDYLFVTINLGLLILFQAWLLLRYINQSNKDLSNFFYSIINDDYSPTYTRKNKNQIYEYQRILDRISEIIKSKSIEIEKQKQYLEYAFQNAQVGLISYDEELKVDLMNQQAMELLGINKLGTLQDLALHFPKLTETIVNSPLEKTIIHKEILSSKEHPDIKETRVFTISKSIFTLNNRKVNLISFSNIKNELDNQELESWQKLIRVLTHEIMNSVSPIPALTSNIQKAYLNKETQEFKEVSELTDKDISVTLKGLKTIEQSSHNLLSFVKQYRSLTLLPQPTFTNFKLKDVFTNIQNLLTEDLHNNKISFNTTVNPSDLTIQADRTMIDQVFINLAKNAIAALKTVKKKKITIHVNKTISNKIHIQFSDSGEGFTEEIAEKIFIPFFSTKDDGSGIGLSLSRQIIRLHGGDINAYSTPGKGTKFVIQL